MTKDHQTPAERQIGQTDELVEQIARAWASMDGKEFYTHREGYIADARRLFEASDMEARILADAEVIKKTQAALEHQTERLRIAIERAEKAEAQREADAEAIKAAEAVLKQSDYLDEMSIPALVDLRQALQARAKKGGV